MSFLGRSWSILLSPDDAEVFDRVIDTHVKNIRTKLRKISKDAEIIRSVYGVGYAFEEMDSQRLMNAGSGALK